MGKRVCVPRCSSANLLLQKNVPNQYLTFQPDNGKANVPGVSWIDFRHTNLPVLQEMFGISDVLHVFVFSNRLFVVSEIIF
jgi:hypothetical protein